MATKHELTLKKIFDQKEVFLSRMITIWKFKAHKIALKVLNNISEFDPEEINNLSDKADMMIIAMPESTLEKDLYLCASMHWVDMVAKYNDLEALKQVINADEIA